MTTSDPKPPSALVRIINSGWATAGTVLALPLTGAAVATGGWGWAVGAGAALGIGVTAAAFPRRPPSPQAPPRPTGPVNYYFLSPSRVAWVHAHIHGGRVGIKTRGEMRERGVAVKAGFSLPPANLMNEFGRKISNNYSDELQVTPEIMADEVRAYLSQRDALHDLQNLSDVDLQRLGRRVDDTEGGVEFATFIAAGPDVHAAIDKVPEAPENGPDSTCETILQAANGFTITLRVGSRKQLDDFDDLEKLPYVTVFGVLRGFDADRRAASVRVIAVY